MADAAPAKPSRRRRLIAAAVALALIVGGALGWRAVPATWAWWQCERALAEGQPRAACLHYARFARWRGSDEEALLRRVALAVVAGELPTYELARLVREMREPPPVLIEALERRHDEAADPDEAILAAGALAEVGGERWRERLRDIAFGDITLAPSASEPAFLRGEAASWLARVSPPDAAAIAWARAVVGRASASPTLNERLEGAGAIDILGLLGDGPDDVARVETLYLIMPDAAIEALWLLADREPTRAAAIASLRRHLDDPIWRVRAAGRLLSAGEMEPEDVLATWVRHRAEWRSSKAAPQTWPRSELDIRWWIAETLDGRGERAAMSELLDEVIADDGWLAQNGPSVQALAPLYYFTTELSTHARPERKRDPRLRALAQRKLRSVPDTPDDDRGDVEACLYLLGHAGAREDLPLLWPLLAPPRSDYAGEPRVSHAAAAALMILDRPPAGAPGR